MDYNELAEFAQNMPRIPRREMRCHPLVLTALRSGFSVQELASKLGYLGLPNNLMTMNVFEVPVMDPGAWEILEDGEITATGNCITPRKD